MKKYRKKPVEVEAIQWTRKNINEMDEFLRQNQVNAGIRLVSYNYISPIETELKIETFEMQLILKINYWIVILDGDIEIYKPTTFEKYYEEIR